MRGALDIAHLGLGERPRLQLVRRDLFDEVHDAGVVLLRLDGIRRVADDHVAAGSRADDTLQREIVHHLCLGDAIAPRLARRE